MDNAHTAVTQADRDVADTVLLCQVDYYRAQALAEAVATRVSEATADLQARLEAAERLLAQCLKWLPLLDSHEPGSTTDLLCDSISEALATTRNADAQGGG